MVKIMEKRIFKWMIWGENPLFFGNIQINKSGPKAVALYPKESKQTHS